MNGLEGVENAHKFLLLEAEGIAKGKNIHGDEEIAPVKVDIKSLAEILQEDALFLEYDQKNRDKIRSAFRLPHFIQVKLKITTERQLTQQERLLRNKYFSLNEN